LPFIIALFITCSIFGQEGDRTTILLNTFLSVDETSVQSSSFDGFLKMLEKKHGAIKEESKFIHYLFSKTHKEYLKKYENYTSMSNVFKTGSYNCLTGTILYSLLLDHFQIDYKVIETNYHIFILVETKQGKILLESTDPLNGFVTNEHEIESRINVYKANSTLTSSSKMHYYQFNFELFNAVSINELRGLLYYNKSVDALNHQNLQEAVQYLKNAHALYSSPRIDEFSQILLLALQQSTLENQLRTECIKTVLSIKRDLMPLIASLN